jgi:hypothetical protein
MDARVSDGLTARQALLDPEVVVTELALFALLGGEHVAARRCKEAVDPRPVAGEGSDGLPYRVATLGSRAPVALGGIEQ